jgi:hypothetical protein
MKKICSLTRKQLASAGFFKLCFVLVFGIIAGTSLASAQTTLTPQAYSFWTHYSPVGARDAFCPYPNLAQVVTLWRSTRSPNDTRPTWSADGSQIAFTSNLHLHRGSQLIPGESHQYSRPSGSRLVPRRRQDRVHEHSRQAVGASSYEPRRLERDAAHSQGGSQRCATCLVTHRGAHRFRLPWIRKNH